MSNPNALLLLADHIKLSLLEQKRARTLNLARDSQDGHISRSLDQFREGLDAIEKEHQRLQEVGDASKATALADTLASLRKQYTDLSSQFQGHTSTSTTATLTHPNDPSLAADFAHAQSSHTDTTASPPPASQQQQPKKAVRFSSPTTDLESQTSATQNRPAHFPYRDDIDDDSAGYRDHIAAQDLTNDQIHTYHDRILSDQDAQLDALGASIARQRELSMQIGDELDSQVLLLDESERAADRQLGTLARARRQVSRVARSAGSGAEGRQMGIIVLLIIVLVLLIVIVK
ncbi:hypothetical protein C8A05DRAFT_44408 [Staphylotrichum tortipilum]|uniref:t-SNARE coiled-coil homology domain-containing protein n=1 Tax=Staphylotrichum tortipilum TaxID=2831512 RepID=A0AAN6RTN0_9PEZI|nr:hypothetical protein C8A05DRAFT_44408 [Staphylotrichum longicolle]